MALIVPEESQRPYRFGMTLVCIGALFNWLGLADHHTKPVPAVRYIGVGLVASGAVLICMAMCFWMNSVRDDEDDESVDHIHVISLDPPMRLDEKPPDYATVVDVPPPCYDDAIKLDPQRLVTDTGHRMAVVVVPQPQADACVVTMPADECDKALAGDAVDTSAADANAAAQQQQQQQQPSTTLAQAIRKSIRDIRKQLTNTVTDAVATEPELQQPQQPCPQQSGSEHDGTVAAAAASKPNATIAN